jgi:tRNA-intron lyase
MSQEEEEEPSNKEDNIQQSIPTALLLSTGTSLVISNSPSQTEQVWNMGSYGCSTRRTRFKPQFLEKPRKNRRRNNKRKSTTTSSTVTTTTTTSNPNIITGEDEIIPPESLQLNVVEAGYLLDKKRIRIIDVESQTEITSTQQLLDKTSQHQIDSSYHHGISLQAQYLNYEKFRDAGWTPKNGSQYGCDTVLYALDPDRCHSKFTVTMKNREENTSVLSLVRLLRVAEQTRKLPVLCDEDGNCVRFKRWVLKQDDKAIEKQKQQQLLNKGQKKLLTTTTSTLNNQSSQFTNSNNNSL